jgi:hypothetical protein
MNGVKESFTIYWESVRLSCKYLPKEETRLALSYEPGVVRNGLSNIAADHTLLYELDRP